VASGKNESAIEDELREHMKSQHSMDGGSIEGMLGDMKEKIAGMSHR
jgi:predicted small metal-binding protein